MYVPALVRVMFVTLSGPKNARTWPVEFIHLTVGRGCELLVSQNRLRVSVSLTVVMPVITGGLKSGEGDKIPSTGVNNMLTVELMVVTNLRQ